MTKLKPLLTWNDDTMIVQLSIVYAYMILQIIASLLYFLLNKKNMQLLYKHFTKTQWPVSMHTLEKAPSLKSAVTCSRDTFTVWSILDEIPLRSVSNKLVSLYSFSNQPWFLVFRILLVHLRYHITGYFLKFNGTSNGTSSFSSAKYLLAIKLTWIASLAWMCTQWEPYK